MAPKKKAAKAEQEIPAPLPDAPAPEPDKRRKKDKKEKKDKKAKGGKKSGIFGKLLRLLLILGVIGGLVAVIGFNALDLREKYLRGVINKIPVVSGLLPAPEGADAEPVEQPDANKLAAQVKAQEQAIEEKDAAIADLNRRIDLYTAEITRLQDIETLHEQYKSDKEEFDKMIVAGAPDAYTKFFESIDPENADILYKEALGVVQASADLKRYVNTVSAMDESAAAKMLANLLPTDLDLVVMILKNIDNEQCAAILGAMPSDQSATVIKRMAPAQQ